VTCQIEEAFAAGYDPALELATHQIRKATAEGLGSEFDFDIAPWTENLRRKEQDWIDRIVQGAESGHYFMLLGPKVLISHRFTHRY
jgi:hypothetical protein